MPFLAACTKVQQENVPDAICFNLDLNDLRTKATLFDGGDCLTDKENGGGDFRLYAYLDGTATPAINNARVNHIINKGVLGWYFRDENGTPDIEADDKIVDYYWPLGVTMDFFGHMPMDLSDTGITLGTYSGIAGPSFSCDLPLDNAGQENIQEFIYAYTENQTVATQNANNGVRMNFRHPLSCVVFRLGQSYRIKINSVSLTNIYKTGNFSNGTWTGTGAGNHSLNIVVNKTVGDGINYNSLIGGPYLVMPQSFTTDDSRLVLNYDYGSEIGKTASLPIRALSTEGWDSGKKYTYTLNMGDRGEEVIFTVKVDEWDVVEYKNEIDVEYKNEIDVE